MSHELIVSKTQDISNIAGNVPGQAKRFALEAAKATSILARAKVESQTNAEDAATFIKALTVTLNDANEVRLSFTRPLDEVKEMIISQFRDSIDILMAVKHEVQRMLTAWLKAEQIRKEAEAATEAARQTAEATRIANAMRAAGDDEDADEVERLAEQVKPNTSKAVVTGSLGGTAGLRRRVSGQLPGGKNKAKFLGWAAKNFTVDQLEQVTIGKKLLNDLAKLVDEGKLEAPPGLVVVSEDRAQIA